MLRKKGLLANVKCISVDELNTQKPFGIHPLYLGLHHSYDTWKLVKYPLDKMLSELEGKVKPVQVETRKTETDDVLYHSFQKENEQLTIETSKEFALLEKNGILEAARRLYREEIEKLENYQ